MPAHARTHPHTQSALERCLQQLVVVHGELLEANGGQGEPLLLSQHLRH